MNHVISQSVTIPAEGIRRITCQTCCVYMDTFFTVLSLRN